MLGAKGGGAAKDGRNCNTGRQGEGAAIDGRDDDTGGRLSRWAAKNGRGEDKRGPSPSAAGGVGFAG